MQTLEFILQLYMYSVAALVVQAGHEQDKIPLVSFQLHSNFLNILYLLVCTSMCLLGNVNEYLQSEETFVVLRYDTF